MDKLEELENTINLKREQDYYSIAQDGYVAGIYKSVLGSPEGLKRLWKILDQMGQHQDALVKVILLMQLPQLALASEEEDRVQTTQWRLILEYLVHGDDRIRMSSQMVLLFLLKNQLLDREIVEECFCPAVDQACSFYLDTLDLMCKMAGIVGREATEKYFLQRFVKCCSHESFHIRENCVKNLPEMCSVVGSESAEVNLLPVFIKLCHDPVPNVRSACIDTFLPVARHISLDKRRSELTAAFTDLLLDSCESCRLSAYRTLGAFICTFADPATTGVDFDKLAELLTLDRFEHQFGERPSAGIIRTVSGDLHLKNCDESENLFTPNHIKKLFPGFSEYPVDQNISADGDCLKDSGDDFFDMFESFQEFQQFRDPGRDAIVGELVEKPVRKFSYSQLAGLNADSVSGEEDECNIKDSSELDEFNSFRFWQIPLVELEAMPEPEKNDVDCYSNEKAWDLPERMTDITNTVMKMLDVKFVNSECLDHDSNNEQEMEAFEMPLSPIQCSTPDDANLWDPMVSGNGDIHPNQPAMKQDVVPQKLLECFVAMGNQPHMKKEPGIDQEKAQSCASWLPAVALTLGSENWPCIKDTYKCLSVHFQWKVRRTVASFIHELASMLGEEVTVKDLVPIFDDLMTDIDDVRIGALQHLGKFFKNLVPDKRKYFLTQLLGFLKINNFKKWRIREELAEQLKSSMNLFTESDCFTYFVPLATNLLCDEVASVRHKAVELMSDLIVYLTGESHFQSSLVNQLLREFASHSSWRRRQIFVLLCSHLVLGKVLDNELFSTFFLSHLLELSRDSVPNVGLSVARCLSVDIVRNRYISSSSPHFESIMKVLNELEWHKDRDVRYFASLHNCDMEEVEEEDGKNSEQPEPDNKSETPNELTNSWLC